MKKCVLATTVQVELELELEPKKKMKKTLAMLIYGVKPFCTNTRW